MNEQDSTKLILEQLLYLLHKEQARETAAKDTSYLEGRSYLMGQDRQLLGTLARENDPDSVLNKYGPFGSPYSPTSIFNSHSPYGSQYGAYSLNNPYCNTPPWLFINGNPVGLVTVNNQLSDRIPTDTFLYLLKNDPESLVNESSLVNKSSEKPDVDIRSQYGGSFIVAEDGQFLGKLTSNTLDSESVLNKTGPYGNEYSPTSVFNKFGDYGNGFSSLSAFNPFSPTPPKIFVDGKLYGYLTENEGASGGKKIDPKQLKHWIRENF
ncbi:hypothetical protein [Anseongella ginsenosidimutans]|uniref:hypothetical protein n=1 Tax=Anseongella ginsenosidimutans TaxID=496056 RepID=UPI0010505F84|nr:hypothetical protein [Anseongella ginsenosidimutans]QEC52154.1 hypothetical protein FRZ59_07260 [Anseongella ginsenosidimutans]